MMRYAALLLALTMHSAMGITTPCDKEIDSINDVPGYKDKDNKTVDGVVVDCPVNNQTDMTMFNRTAAMCTRCNNVFSVKELYLENIFECTSTCTPKINDAKYCVKRESCSGCHFFLFFNETFWVWILLILFIILLTSCFSGLWFCLEKYLSKFDWWRQLVKYTIFQWLDPPMIR